MSSNNPKTPASSEKAEEITSNDTNTYTCRICGSNFSSHLPSKFCIKCGAPLSSDTLDSNPLTPISQKPNERPPPDIFYCPRCHTAHKFEGNPRFCIQCGFQFMRDPLGNILVDEAHYGLISAGQINQFIPGGYAPPSTGYYYPPPMYGRPKKPKSWSVQAGLFMPITTIILITIGAAIIILPLMFLSPELLSTGPIQFLLGASSVLFFVIPVWWVAKYYPQRKLTFRDRLEILGLPLNKYPKKELGRELLLGVVCGVGGVLLVYIMTEVSWHLTNFFFGVDPYSYEGQGLLDQFSISVESPWDVIWFVLLNLLFVGVPEEIMFRGFVQKSFESRLKVPAATLFTAIVFALFHIFIYITIPALFFFLFIPYLVISIALGLLRNARQDLIAPIIMHIIYNITQVVMIGVILF
jgi:membrane protease YdiL (CAAX protease family)/ribosomal protein L37E